MGVPPYQPPSQDPFGEAPFASSPQSGPPIYSQQPSQGYPLPAYPRHHTPRSWPHTAQPRPTGTGRNPHLHWWIGGAVMAVLTLVAVSVLVVGGGHDNQPARPPAASIQTGAPAQASVHAAAPSQTSSASSASLSDLLLGQGDISTQMKTAMASAASESGSAPLTLTVTPPNCSSAYAPATAAGYQGGRFSELAVQGFRGPGGNPDTGVIEAVAKFPDASAAQDFYHQQFSAWGTCKYTRVTGTYSDGKIHTVKVAVPGDDGTTATDNMFAIGSAGSAGCERAMTVKSVYVIDIRVCRGQDAGGNAGGYANSIAHAIQRRIS